MVAWALIGLWDTLVAQLLPPEISEKAPTVYVVGHKVLSVMSGWLPWWGWALVGMALLTGLSIEYAYLTRGAMLDKQSETERHAVRLSDALYSIIDNSGWVSEFGRDSFLDQAENALRQAARDEEITIRGRREIDRHGAGDHFDQTWEDIKPSYWRTHEFELAAVMCAEPHYATSETAVVSPGNINAELLPHYAMLRVWNDELEKRWPVANT